MGVQIPSGCRGVGSSTFDTPFDDDLVFSSFAMEIHRLRYISRIGRVLYTCIGF